MKSRIKAIRELNEESQTMFAQKISVSRSAVCKMESGENSPSEQTIKLICQTYSINEEWLRTGQGEMKREKTRNQKVLEFTNDALESMDGSFKKKLLMALSKLTEKDWEHLADIAERILKEE